MANNKLEKSGEEQDDDRPTIPDLPIVLPKARPKLRKMYETPAAAFFAGCDAWEYRPQPRTHEMSALDERLADEANAIWWVSERRRWLSRWVFFAAMISIVIVVVAFLGHGK